MTDVMRFNFGSVTIAMPPKKSRSRRVSNVDQIDARFGGTTWPILATPCMQDLFGEPLKFIMSDSLSL